MPLQIFKRSWIECWWVLVLPSATLMTSLIFNVTLGNHMHHLQEMFERFKEHNPKFHLGKC
jgi:hypothetical protein